MLTISTLEDTIEDEITRWQNKRFESNVDGRELDAHFDTGAIAALQDVRKLLRREEVIGRCR